MSLNRSRLTQLVWLAVVVAGFIPYVTVLLQHWTAIGTACHPDSACRLYQINTTSARTLLDHGLSMSSYALFNTVVFLFTLLLCYALGGLVIWRKPRDRGAALTAFFLAICPVWPIELWFANQPGGLTTFFISALLFFVLLFPDATFRPRWTLWLGMAIVPATLAPILGSVGIIVFLAVALAVCSTQLYRYRNVLSWGERQQTKWSILGLVVAVAGVLVIFLSYMAGGIPQGSLFWGLSNPLLALAMTVFPISITIAILRSQLWDIDRVISRSLAYLLLTATLAGIYVGSVVAMQAIFRALTGQQSDVAIAVSTLIIAALFNPLRRRFRDFIARMFYRTGYDIRRVLADFGEMCRDETDIDRLRQRLALVVQENLHPEHLSVWIRESHESV